MATYSCTTPQCKVGRTCCSSLPSILSAHFLQAYFSYDAHKSGGVTTSHLRFGPAPIRAPYLVQQAHYIGVHQSTYAAK